MPNFCTLFNKKYLSRGSTMIKSLLAVDPSSTIYVFSLDSEVHRYVSSFKNLNVISIPNTEFENAALLKLKSERTIAEYCWTLTAFIIDYSITVFNLPECTYLDADLYFYSSTRPIFDELNDYSIGIIEHRFPEVLKHLEVHGKYNVQFMYFKNDFNGREALRWWKEKCLDWCYARLEDNKYGDQLYLDGWTEKFKKVREISNIGAGVAPWNMVNYSLSYVNSKPKISQDGSSCHEVIFFHYHGTKIFANGLGVISNYPTNYQFSKNLFTEYAANVVKEEKKIQSFFGEEFEGTFSDSSSYNLKKMYRNMIIEESDSVDCLYQWSNKISKSDLKNVKKISIFNKLKGILIGRNY